ncbi:MAG TPA: zinc transporter ZntB [Woeseiaceae bacterium]|nr:zinc transporter ZntB [Woeseiaceae bacterium]
MSTGRMPGISARVLDGRGNSTHLDDAGLHGWTAAAQGTLWVDLDINDAAGRAWLRNEAKLGRTVIDSLLAGETRPRSLAVESGLLIVVRGVNLNPGADPEDMVAVRIWLERERIITSHRRPILSLSDVGGALDTGSGPTSSGRFLVFLIGKLTDRIGHVVEQIEDETDSIEMEIQHGDVGGLRAQLADLRRQTASIRRFLAPQRDALDRLYRQPGGVLTDLESQELREETDRLTRHLEDLDLARERALVTQEELLNRVAQEQNQRMYLLSVVAAIFLPLTFLTGLLGMNVAGLPGTEAPYGFAVSVIAMVLAGIGMGVFFRWRKWI